MVRDGSSQPLYRRLGHRHGPRLALYIRYPRATSFLRTALSPRHLPHTRRANRHGDHVGLAAGNQRPHPRRRTRTDGGAGSHAPPGKWGGSDRVKCREGSAVTSPAPENGGGPDLSVTLAGIPLKNPVIAASGTFGYGVEFEDVVHLNKLGGFVVKGLSRESMIGNPPPRLWETTAGMLNAIGLQNIGAAAFLEEKLPRLREIKDIVVLANVFGYTREDYEGTIEILNDGEGIAAYELNVSCPNTAHGGLQFGSDPRSLDEVVTTAKRVARRPLIVKLSPNVTSIAQMAHIAQEAGADAISLINTFVAMAIDPDTRKPRIANVTAGLSGPAIKPIALRMVYDAAHAVNIPVIGMGGIGTPADVVEFMLAGASAVQVGTASYFDPVATETLVEDLMEYCREQRIERLSDLTGGMLVD